MIEHNFCQFLKDFHDGRTWILALSGGPDSMALFHLLRKYSVPFEVAHVNHNWRKESSLEAEKLYKLCQVHDIIFHLKNLDIGVEVANLEDQCRQARLLFFRQLMKPGIKGIMLGHHAGDVVETVLKRFLEGSRLTKLGGIKLVSHLSGIQVFRPLLTNSKQQILDWLSEQGYWFFNDITNLDSRFLRNRLRIEVIPFLERSLGKRITANLMRIAISAQELEEDILHRISLYDIQRQGDEFFLNVQDRQPSTTFEWRMLISYFFEQAGITVSQGTIQQVMDHLKQGGGEKVLRLKNCYVKLKRRRLCLYHLCNK